MADEGRTIVLGNRLPAQQAQEVLTGLGGQPELLGLPGASRGRANWFPLDQCFERAAPGVVR